MAVPPRWQRQCLSGDRRLLFIQNCLEGKTELKKVPAGRNLLDNNVPVTGNLSLDAYGCAIVELG